MQMSWSIEFEYLKNLPSNLGIGRVFLFMSSKHSLNQMTNTQDSPVLIYSCNNTGRTSAIDTYEITVCGDTTVWFKNIDTTVTANYGTSAYISFDDSWRIKKFELVYIANYIVIKLVLEYV